MVKFKRPLLVFNMLCLIILLSLGVTGCGSKNYSASKGSETVIPDSSSDVIENIPTAVPEGGTVAENLDDGIGIDKSVSSGYYLSLGVLDRNVVWNGAERNGSEVTVVGKRVIFPQGGIRSISIKSWSRKEAAYNPQKSQIVQYLDALESGEIVDNVPEGVLSKMVKIETHILYLNSHGEFRTISVTDFGDGYHEISVEKDDAEDFAKEIPIKSDAGKKYHQVFLRSMEAEKIIKEWIDWEGQGKKGFETIQSANMMYDGKVDGIKYTENQLKKLKTYLKADKKPATAPCGYENYFDVYRMMEAGFIFPYLQMGRAFRQTGVCM